MKICVFAYNFPHKKTQEGLYKLIQYSHDIECVILADPVQLNFTPSKTRVGVKDMLYEHPQNICERFNIPYVVMQHNTMECENFLHDLNPDLGVILGSRILKDFIIKKFNIGILNLHPGLLPDNRGLDNVKWAIYNGYKQGVTAHLIDKNIDRGILIDKSPISVYEDDTLIDIFLRIQNKELAMMIDAIDKIKAGEIFCQELGCGNYFKPMSEEQDLDTNYMFDNYKKIYNEL